MSAIKKVYPMRDSNPAGYARKVTRWRSIVEWVYDAITYVRAIPFFFAHYRSQCEHKRWLADADCRRAKTIAEMAASRRPSYKGTKLGWPR